MRLRLMGIGQTTPVKCHHGQYNKACFLIPATSLTISHFNRKCSIRCSLVYSNCAMHDAKWNLKKNKITDIMWSKRDNPCPLMLAVSVSLSIIRLSQVSINEINANDKQRFEKCVVADDATFTSSQCYRMYRVYSWEEYLTSDKYSGE